MHYTSKEVYEHISAQNNDPIVKWKICTVSGSQFAIFQSDLDLLEKMSPSFGGKKYLIPLPTLCPEERQRRRLMFRNFSNFFKQTSSYSGESVISNYSPETPFTILSNKERWSDIHEWTQQGKERDPSKSFRQQYQELLHRVPVIALMNDDGTASENCLYTNDANYNKNCYYLFGAWHSENVLYGYWNANRDSDCCDITISNNCQWCYEVSLSQYCRNSTFLLSCLESSDCHFSYNLTWCQHCFLCHNLENKSYCIRNKQYSKEAYEQEMSSLDRSSFSGQSLLRKEYLAMIGEHKCLTTKNLQCEQISWHGNFESHHCRYLFSFREAENCSYLFYGDIAKSCMDLTKTWAPELCYEWLTPDESFRCHFAIYTRNCQNCFYCDMCHFCKDCFGCIGLKHKQYCIFNKQYTKEAYEEVVPQIIQSMKTKKEQNRWEFFDHGLTPFAYNDSVADDCFPIAKVMDMDGQILVNNPHGHGEIQLTDKHIFSSGTLDLWGERKIAVKWRRQEQNQHARVLPTSDMADYIDDVQDNISSQVFACEKTGKAFRILPQELRFYRRMKLPLPRQHPDQRFKERNALIPMTTLFLKKDKESGEEFLSVYG